MVPYCTQMFHVVVGKQALQCALRMSSSPSLALVNTQLDFSVENVCETLFLYAFTEVHYRIPSVEHRCPCIADQYLEGTCR